MLLSYGDALIDFMPTRAADGRDAYAPAVGGSCLNIAVAMARLGAPAGFIGGISTDMFGTIIADHAKASAVDLTYVERSPHETTLAFVRFIDGEPSYAFYDDNTATRHWTYKPGLIPFESVDCLHVGSTSLINDPVSAEALALAEDARDQTTLSFDPNCRPALVDDKTSYVARMAEFTKTADIIRMSDADFEFLYGHRDYTDFATQVMKAGASLMVITRGSQGVSAWHKSAGQMDVMAPQVRLADTIGAGDAFQGALLVALRALGGIERASLMSLDKNLVRRALEYGAAAAAVTCSRPGASPPFAHELPPIGSF